MANKTIAQVSAVVSVDNDYKVPISIGDGNAHTATMLAIKNYCRANSVNWDEIQNKPVFSLVASTGSYTDLSNKPTIPTDTSDLTNDAGYLVSTDLKTINSQSIVGTGNINVSSAQDTETITSTTPSISVAANTVYTCSNNITSLTITSIPSGTTAESELYFTAGGNFTVTLPLSATMVFGSLDCISGSKYAMSFKDSSVVIATPDYTPSYTTQTITYKDANNQDETITVITPTV